MTDEQIGQLESLRWRIRKGQLYWMPDDKTVHRVTHIGNPPKPKDGDIAEPSKVAYFHDGKYAALYNADLMDFKLVESVADLFE